MLGITIQLDISARLTSQVTTIICHHMQKVLLKNIQKEYHYKKTCIIRRLFLQKLTFLTAALYVCGGTASARIFAATKFNVAVN